MKKTERRILLETGVVYGISVLGCILLVSLAGAVPLIRANLHALVALLFIGLGWGMLRWRNLEPSDYGLTTRKTGRALLLCLFMALLLFPPYSLGFHYYQTRVFNRSSNYSFDNYLRWPAWCEGRQLHKNKVTLGCDQSQAITLYWQGALRGRVSSDGRVKPLRGPLRLSPERRAADFLVSSPGFHGLALRTEGRRLNVDLSRSGKRLAPAEIAFASGRKVERLPLSLNRSGGWIGDFLLAQLLVVALPEELFYRGYLMGRLNLVFRRRRQILGASVGWALPLSATLFAFGHFLIDFNPVRLGVFFPGLLFGWMVARSGNIIGALVFHALCNVLVRMLEVHFF